MCISLTRCDGKRNQMTNQAKAKVLQVANKANVSGIVIESAWGLEYCTLPTGGQ